MRRTVPFGAAAEQLKVWRTSLAARNRSTPCPKLSRVGVSLLTRDVLGLVLRSDRPPVVLGVWLLGRVPAQRWRRRGGVDGAGPLAVEAAGCLFLDRGGARLKARLIALAGTEHGAQLVGQPGQEIPRDRLTHEGFPTAAPAKHPLAGSSQSGRDVRPNDGTPAPRYCSGGGRRASPHSPTGRRVFRFRCLRRCTRMACRTSSRAHSATCSGWSRSGPR
jgi:hypothetical protein